jgi:hypothetical protein
LSGIEAASQLEMLCSVEEVCMYVLASTKSSIQLLSPFARESHSLSGSSDHRALEKGKGLLKVVISLLPDNALVNEFQQQIASNAGHHFCALFVLA